MVAVRYAKALFELAREKNILEAIAGDMQGIAESAKAAPDLCAFLENPVVKEQFVCVFGKSRSQGATKERTFRSCFCKESTAYNCVVLKPIGGEEEGTFFSGYLSCFPTII